MRALYAVAFLSSLGFSIVIPFMVFLVLRFGGNAFVLGTIGALFWSAQFFGASWLGSLSDRIGRKRVLLRSQLGALTAWSIFLAALCVPTVVLARVTSPVTGAFTVTLPLVLIALSRMTDGVFNGSVSVANAYMADLTTGDARKLGYARLGVATNLGFVLGPLVSGLVARSDAGVIAIVLVALALSASAALLVHLRLPEVPPHRSTGLDVARAGGVKAHKLLGGGCREHVRRPPGRIRSVLEIAELRPMIAIYFLVFLGFSMYTAALPIHAAQDLGWSTTTLGLYFTTLSLSLVLTEFLVLPVATRHVPSVLLGAGGSALVMLAYVLMALHADLALLAGAVLYGVGNGLSWPAYLDLLSRTGPAEVQGTVQGVGSSVGSLASVVGTLAGGVLVARIGPATLYVCAASVGCASLLFVQRRNASRSKSASSTRDSKSAPLRQDLALPHSRQSAMSRPPVRPAIT